MSINPVHVHSFNLLLSAKAFKTLYGREPEITAQGNFDDVDGEAIFGPVRVVSIRRTQFTFEADGALYNARIDDVHQGFILS